MCGCAGSSTDRTTSLSLARPGTVRTARESTSRGISPARSGWISSSAGQGFMSTQRRENRWQRIRRTERQGAPGLSSPGPAAQFARALATVSTAPPQHAASLRPSDESLSPGTTERLATNSLQSDHRSVRLFPQDLRHRSRSAPPSSAALGAPLARPATHRFSPRHTPNPPGFALLHPSLP